MRTHSWRYCALSRLGGRDIAGGVCLKKPTGGDLRRAVFILVGNNIIIRRNSSMRRENQCITP